MPPALLPYCTEQPLYVPRCYQVSDRQRAVSPKPARAAYGLPDEALRLLQLQQQPQIHAELFAAWMRVLNVVPGSVLWLLADNDTARDNLLREAAAAGVAAERLIFAPRVAPPEYLARFQLADLVLDTFPFNAGTTASDALWMGTPILTRAGRSYISRMAGSLLHAVGAAGPGDRQPGGLRTAGHRSRAHPGAHRLVQALPGRTRPHERAVRRAAAGARCRRCLRNAGAEGAGLNRRWPRLPQRYPAGISTTTRWCTRCRG